MSSFTWLDFCEHERQRALDVIDLFREEEARDELGLGVLRDAFAEKFFPGTSTIQTRVRYFLFVPWICRRLEGQRVSSSQAHRQLRRRLGKVRDGLMDAGEELGVIGRRAAEHVLRLPSSVYWGGLGRWGIRRFPGSENEYLRSLDSFYRREDRVLRRRDAEGESEPLPTNWDPNLPDPPASFPAQITFALEPHEAEYLIDRVGAAAPDSLLHELLQRGVEVQAAEFPWDLPEVTKLPVRLQESLEHARNFSELMHGAMLLYNFLLAEATRNEDRVDEYREMLEQWWAKLQARWGELTTWDRGAFWRSAAEAGARVPVPLQGFVDQWILTVLEARSASQLRDHRELLEQRERKLKGNRARLTNAQARQGWSGRSGTAQLDYRWRATVRQMVSDLLAPVEGPIPTHA